MCVFVCVCVRVCVPYMCMQRAAVGEEGRKLDKFFWGGEETLENSHTHTHSRQLHMTQWRPADFHTPTSNLLTFILRGLFFNL